MPLVKLFAAPTTLEVHHLRSHLESHGVKATVMGESLEAARGQIPLTAETLPAVYVEADDADRAMAITRQWLSVKPSEAERTQRTNWHCPKCGELVEQQFDTCWQCGAARPDV